MVDRPFAWVDLSCMDKVQLSRPLGHGWIDTVPPKAVDGDRAKNLITCHGSPPTERS